MKAYCGSGGIAPRILDLGVLSLAVVLIADRHMIYTVHLEILHYSEQSRITGICSGDGPRMKEARSENEFQCTEAGTVGKRNQLWVNICGRDAWGRGGGGLADFPLR
jgi:hypothetical protein